MDAKVKKRKAIFFAFTVFFVAVIASIYLAFNREKNVIISGEPNPDETASTTTITKDGITFVVSSGSNPRIEQVDIKEDTDLGPVPSLDRTVTIPVHFSSEAEELFRTRLASAKKYLLTDLYSYDGWINIGQLWQMIEDYEGARLAYGYATKIGPTRHVAFGNLGFLYGYYFKDFVKAETNFLKALDNAPNQLYLYQQTFEFYRDIMKDEARALNVIDRGEKITGEKVFFENLRSTIR